MAPNEDQTAADQAAQAPGVATAGVEAAPGTIETNEVVEEQREHLERRTESQLPNPGEQAAQTGTDQPQGDVPADQLPSDGDQVKDGVQDNGGTEAGA